MDNDLDREAEREEILRGIAELDAGLGVDFEVVMRKAEAIIREARARLGSKDSKDSKDADYSDSGF